MSLPSHFPVDVSLLCSVWFYSTYLGRAGLLDMDESQPCSQ